MHQLHQLRIVCPNCNTLLPSIKMVGLSELHCLHCKAYYSVQQGFLDLIPEPSSRRNISQVLMEWVPLIRIYESRWYRYSPLAAWLFGISFQNEYNLITNYFHSEDLEKMILDSWLNNVVCHHDKRYWIILSADKSV